jgi:hypothetical protein
MAVLTDENRIAVWAKYMEDVSSDRTSIGISKVDLRAAINGVDDWVNDNAVSFNNAFPEPSKSALTNKEKAAILFRVVNKRWEVI